MDVDAHGDVEKAVIHVVFFVREVPVTRGCRKQKLSSSIIGRVRLRVPRSEKCPAPFGLFLFVTCS